MNTEQPPYEYFRKLFGHAGVVPFLGAGASFPDRQSEELDPLANLPTGKQLANRLAECIRLPGEEVNINNLIEVASYYALWAGRHYLEKELEEVFDSKQRPGSIHHFLAEVSAPLIITTNYDTLIEQAFRERGRNFHMVMTPIYRHYDYKRRLLWWAPDVVQPVIQEIKEFSPIPKDLPVIYKIHGGFDPTGKWQSSVITEDDYFEIGGRIYEASLLPPYIQLMLADSHLLFLGYSLRDIHVRHMISDFRRQFNKQRDFLITKSVSNLDRERFRLLGLDIYELTVAAFTEGLRQSIPNPDAT
ncbi:MAG: SIR2 family protein [Acidobacteriota bacterium]|nr:SIR2 family protein [Acidobacteriota bacterium]